MLSEPLRQTVSGIDGQYVFSGLASGSYVLTVPQQAGISLTTPPFVEVNLSEGAVTGRADFGLAWYHARIYMPLILLRK